MEIKDKLKQRRMERLRELRETADGESGFVIPLHGEIEDYRDPEWHKRMEDPEFAWRQKYKWEAARMAKESNNENGGGWLTPPTSRSIWAKLLISGVLLAVVGGLTQVKQPWADQGIKLVKISLTKSFDFQAAAAWYEERFGSSPAFIPTFPSHITEDAVKVSTTKRTYFIPVPGKIITSFDSSSHPGVLLQTKGETPVYALDTGQVIYVGDKEGTGLTVIIRHPGGLETSYGRISQGLVEVNDWIKGGEAIGMASKGEGETGVVFFGMTKEGRPMNPLDVIKFD
jgi:stage IV sporulation protein FA